MQSRRSRVVAAVEWQLLSTQHGRGLNGSHRPTSPCAVQLPEIHQFLDGFYLSRIGIRILIGARAMLRWQQLKWCSCILMPACCSCALCPHCAGQHIALHEPPKADHIGLICTRCSPVKVAQGESVVSWPRQLSLAPMLLPWRHRLARLAAQTRSTMHGTSACVSTAPPQRSPFMGTPTSPSPMCPPTSTTWSSSW